MWYASHSVGLVLILCVPKHANEIVDWIKRCEDEKSSSKADKAELFFEALVVVHPNPLIVHPTD